MGPSYPLLGKWARKKPPAAAFGTRQGVGKGVAREGLHHPRGILGLFNAKSKAAAPSKGAAAASYLFLL